MEKFESSRNGMELLGFDLDDFMDETYIEECVELIANDNFDPTIQFSSNYDYGCDHGLLGEMSHGEVENEGDEFSGTTTTTTTTTTTGGNTTKRKRDDKRVDRMKTLTLERKRRSQMKGTLYELRSLVPNITKMDKASIIGDAVQYIQELQNKIMKLQNDIVSLEESSFTQQSNEHEDEGESMYTPPQLDVLPIQPTPIIIKNILQMDVFQMDKREYHGRIVCEKGKGIAPSLYAALDSIEYVDVPSSFLTTVGDKFIFTFSMKVEEVEVDMNLASMKLWIASALIEQGFQFVALPFSD